MKIFKYTLESKPGVPQKVAMPMLFKVISTKVVDNKICVWAIVDEQAPTEDVTFYAIWTGEPANHVAGCNFIDTVVDFYGLVWHIFYKHGGW